jgi:hypothetical protein
LWLLGETERCFALAKPRVGTAKTFCDDKKLFVGPQLLPQKKKSTPS